MKWKRVSKWAIPLLALCHGCTPPPAISVNLPVGYEGSLKKFLALNPDDRLKNILANKIVPEDARTRPKNIKRSASAHNSNDPLLVRLAAEAATTRLQAMQEAAQAKDKRAVPLLLKEIEKRRVLAPQACQALAQIGDLSVISTLVDALSAKHFDRLTASALIALGTLKYGRASNRMASFTNHTNVIVRMAALEALGMCGNQKSIKIIEKSMLDEKEIQTLRVRAAVASARLQSPAGRRFLTDVYSYGNSKMRREALTGMADAAMEDTMTYLHRAMRDNDPALWLTAVKIFLELNPNVAIPVLRGYRYEPNVRTRDRATLALGALGDPRSLPAIIGLLSSKDWRMRTFACEAAGRLKKESSIDALMKIAKTDRMERVRASAVLALGAFTTVEAENALYLASGDNSMQVRLAAVLALAAQKGERIKRSEIETTGKHFDTGMPFLSKPSKEKLKKRLEQRQMEYLKAYRLIALVGGAPGKQPTAAIIQPKVGEAQMVSLGQDIYAGWRVVAFDRAANGSVTIKKGRLKVVIPSSHP